jgi:spore coat polysaccharide biosynthesis protein SpsF
MLSRVYVRTARATTLDEVIFATTTDASDDPVAEYCDFSGIPFTRGSLFDVLDRYYQTALHAKADVVVRITADCPVIDPELIDNVVNTLSKMTMILFATACPRRGLEPTPLAWMWKPVRSRS